MKPIAVRLENANRMIVSATSVEDGLEVAFADGCRGLVTYAEIPEIAASADVEGLLLETPYEVVVSLRGGGRVELPWDFLRHYCDGTYKQQVEKVAAQGREALGRRVRSLREEARLSQAELAREAGIGRVTLVRLENGEQSPRYDTILALAGALRRDPADLLLS